MDMPDMVIQGVNLRELDQRMQQVEWNNANGPGIDFRLKDDSEWQREKMIEQVVNDINRIRVIVEGRIFADALTLKHWSS